jgi:hypothetical protein
MSCCCMVVSLENTKYEGCPKSKVTCICWEALLYPPNSPDLVLSDCHLFRPLKKHLSTWSFMSDEVHHEVHFWLIGLVTDCCSGMGNLVKCWDKCLNKYGDYVEKQLKYTHFFHCIFTLFWLNIFKEKICYITLWTTLVVYFCIKTTFGLLMMKQQSK